MKPKYQAACRPTIQGMRALVMAAYGKRLKIRLFTSGLICAMAAGFVFYTRAKPLSVIILALALAFAWFFLKSRDRMAEKLLAASPNQALVTEFRFMDDALYTHNSLEDTVIAYPDLLRCAEGKEFFSFYLKDGGAFAIGKKDFSLGDPARFAGFLKNKTGRDVLRG